MDGYVGEIRAFAFNYAPRNWLQCNGALVPVQQNTALFSLIGVQFGGNGSTNFGLPNFGGVALLGEGQGPGLSTYVTGQIVGNESVTLQVSEMPAHTHGLHGKVVTGSSSAMGNVPSSATFLSRLLTSSGTNQAGYLKAPLSLPTQMSPTVIGPTGSSSPHENRQPLLALMVCICAYGEYPARN